MRLALSTSGGDCPGLNAVIRGATGAAVRRGFELVGIRSGFAGLEEENGLVPLTDRNTRGIERTGGTILGAASGAKPFGGGGPQLEEVLGALRERGIDGLIMAGGDGTMGWAAKLAETGFPVVGVPKTIDRDVTHTWTTFGHDSALSIAVENLDRLHTTIESHERLMVVEIMGNHSGWLALFAGIAATAAAIAIPELPFRVDSFADHIREREEAGTHSHLFVVSEGAYPEGGAPFRQGRTGRYGGVADWLAGALADRTGKDSRSLSLGHLVRGGAPTVFDRTLGLEFGAAAVSVIAEGQTGVMVSFRPPIFTTVPLEEVAGKVARISPDAPELERARVLGISLGE